LIKSRKTPFFGSETEKLRKLSFFYKNLTLSQIFCFKILHELFEMSKGQEPITKKLVQRNKNFGLENLIYFALDKQLFSLKKNGIFVKKIVISLTITIRFFQNPNFSKYLDTIEIKRFFFQKTTGKKFLETNLNFSKTLASLPLISINYQNFLWKFLKKK